MSLTGWNSSSSHFRNTSEVTRDDSLPMGAAMTVIFIIVTLLLIVITLVGNVLVICAVFGVRKLRHASNYLLISLAVADFFVALFVMPLAALYQIQAYWNFGPVSCLIWTTFDVLLCSASILNLCAVSVDRYLAITRPLTYATNRTTSRIIVYTVIVWSLASVISVLPVFAFDKAMVAPGVCEVNPTLGYQLYATISAFYIPVLIIILVNCKIFFEASKLQKRPGANDYVEVAVQPSDTCHYPVFKVDQENNYTPQNRFRKRYSISRWLRSIRCLMRLHASRGSRSGRLKESKAARTLSIIMGAFITCWLPFFIIALIKPICGVNCNVPKWMDELTLWLGYSNSGLNPMLYAAFNRDFRVPFREMLCCRCRSMRRTIRIELYAEIYGDTVLCPTSRMSHPPDNSRSHAMANSRTPTTQRTSLM